LDKFKGFRFGNGDFAYVYGMSHRGRDLSVTGFLNKTPKLEINMKFITVNGKFRQ